MGERNSGTHFLQYALQFNFQMQYCRQTRHFFGHNDKVDFPSETLDTMIYFSIVREPIEWIDSLFKRLHHIPPENKVNIDAFLNNEWYSIYEEGENNGKEIMEDRNLLTGERYKNIFEMRNVKTNYLLNEVKKKVKHYYFIKYDDLLHDYENTLNKIASKFRLKRRDNASGPFVTVPKYKGTFNALYAKKPILLSQEIQEYIKKNLDIAQENRMKYLL
jgi:hypothetical protein